MERIERVAAAIFRSDFGDTESWPPKKDGTLGDSEADCYRDNARAAIAALSDTEAEQAPEAGPTVPAVVAMLRRYRKLSADRESGGVVHIIVDDGNVEQHWADKCLAEAENSSEWDRPEDVELARALAEMTPTQRRKVYATDTYP